MAIYKPIRKYYKYAYQDWTQPRLSSNTSYGTLTASEQNKAAWYAFDSDTNSHWEVGYPTTGWLNWKLPEDIIITGIKIRVRTGDRPNLTCRCYTSSDKTTAIGDSITTTSSGQEVNVANIPSEGITTNNIYFDCRSTQDFLGIANITITAKKQIIIEGTVDDHDYSVVEPDKIKDVYKSTERKYYKYGTEPNVAVAGSFARIDKGVASGFSDSNYLKLPKTFNPNGKPWEVLFKLNTGTLASSYNGIFTSNGSFDGILFILKNKVLSLYLSSNGTSWDIASASGITLTDNTIYWLKLKFDGTQYTVDYSTDGEVFLNTIKVSSSTPIVSSSSTWYFGVNSSNSYPWGGSIDLNESYININGERWLSGDSYTKVGSWIENGVVSGFSASNYLTLPNKFNPQNNPWEMVYKVTTGSDVLTGSNLTGGNGNSYRHVFIRITGGNVSLECGSNGTSWNIVSLKGGEILPNTTYYIKAEFTGSAYNLYYATTKDTYTLIASANNSTPIYSNELTQSIGLNRWADGSNGPFLGSIDLSQSYININGKNWWHGTKAYEVNLDGEDVYQDWVQPVLSSNGTMGGNTAAASASRVHQSYDGQPWRAFNGQEADSSGWATNNEALPQWIMFYNPTPFVLRNFTIVNRNHPWTKFTVQGSNDGKNFVDLETFSNDVLEYYVGWDKSISAQNQGSYKYYRFYITATSTGGTDVRQIKLYGSVIVAVGSDSYDYSDVVKKRIAAVFKTGDRKYYKYQDWEQPVLTADGTIGGDSFAVSSNLSDFYKVFDDNNDSYINGFNENCWFTFYNPNPLKVSAIEMLSTGAEYMPRAGTLEYSDNNATWVKVFDWNSNSANPYTMTVDAGYHKYWKVTVVTRGSSIGNADITSVKITAQEAVESTSSDYDYSEVETPQLVYNLKYNLNSSSAYAKEGVVSGSDMFGADRGMAGTQSLNQTSIFTFNTPAPSGKYTGSFIYYSQVNFTMSQVYWRLTYEDGTQEYAYGPTGLGDTAYGGGETATLSLSFIAKKPIKAVTVYANGAGGGSGRYGGLGSIQMFFDGSKQ